jgi:hypothetical protein
MTETFLQIAVPGNERRYTQERAARRDKILQVLCDASRYESFACSRTPMMPNRLAALVDRTFVAGLFCSDSDKTIRYVDEGELIDLCRWTVDIASLPSFQTQAANPPRDGFFTGVDCTYLSYETCNPSSHADFEVGLEFDGAGALQVRHHQWSYILISTISRGPRCPALPGG